MTTRFAAYLDGKEPDEATLKRLIRKAVLTGAFFSRAVRLGLQEQRACSRCSMRWWIICRRRSTCPAIKGIDEDGNEVVRLPNDKEPLALLAFKIMDDPFVGTITFCRIYSGTLLSGTGVINSTREPQGAHRPDVAHACPTTAKTSRRRFAGDNRRAGRG